MNVYAHTYPSDGEAIADYHRFVAWCKSKNVEEVSAWRTRSSSDGGDTWEAWIIVVDEGVESFAFDFAGPRGELDRPTALGFAARRLSSLVQLAAGGGVGHVHQQASYGPQVAPTLVGGVWTVPQQNRAGN